MFWNDNLFKSQFPEGFQYVPEFISEQEENELLREIHNVELHTFKFQGYEAKRKVASFGYDYNFENRVITKGNPIPSSFHFLIQKTADVLSVPAYDFAEFLITEYPVGSVINWHRDAPPFDMIAGISLQSDCIFRLRPQEIAKRSRSSIISVAVKRRSLYIMQREARHEWQHSILPVKQVRYSVTLRTLKGTH